MTEDTVVRPVPTDRFEPTKKEWARTHHRVMTTNTNPVLVKAEPTLCYGVTVSNLGGGNCWLKLHNTSLEPLAGSTPVERTFRMTQPITHIDFATPLMFERGLAYTITGGFADTDISNNAGDGTIDIAYR